MTGRPEREQETLVTLDVALARRSRRRLTAHDPAAALRLAGESSRTVGGARACVDACRYMAGLIVGAINGASKEELLSPTTRRSRTPGRRSRSARR